MASTRQYTISLIRLILPAQDSSQKISFSFRILPLEQTFLGNIKKVKNNNVNFYRQSILVSNLSEGIEFSIYQINCQDFKNLKIKYIISQNQIESVGKIGSIFHSIVQNYQLVWECLPYTENNIDDHQISERQYTQFEELKFRIEEGSSISELSQPRKAKSRDAKNSFRENKKRSNSTKSSIRSYASSEVGSLKNISIRNKKLPDQQSSLFKSCQIEGASRQKRQKISIKNVAYKHLMSELSSFFSRQQI